MVTEYVVPDPLNPGELHVEVPPNWKSPVAKSDTDCDKINEYVIVELVEIFVGVDWEVEKVVGIGEFRYVIEIWPLPFCVPCVCTALVT
jgi:hypothetical protein